MEKSGYGWWVVKKCSILVNAASNIFGKKVVGYFFILITTG